MNLKRFITWLAFLSALLIPSFSAVSAQSSAKGSAELILGKKQLADRKFTEARTRFKASCDKGNAEGCYRLGRIINSTRGGPRDRDAAILAQKKACDASYANACQASAFFLSSKNDRTNKFLMHKKACDLGSFNGCSSVAYAYSRGRGVAKDLRLSFQYKERACGMGNISSCVSVALAHLRGNGVVKNVSKGLGQLRDICYSGKYPFACYMAAKNTPLRDSVEKQKLATLGCEGRNKSACKLATDHLGKLYANSSSPSAARVYKADYLKYNARACAGYRGSSCVRNPEARLASLKKYGKLRQTLVNFRPTRHRCDFSLSRLDTYSQASIDAHKRAHRRKWSCMRQNYQRNVSRLSNIVAGAGGKMTLSDTGDRSFGRLSWTSVKRCECSKEIRNAANRLQSQSNRAVGRYNRHLEYDESLWKK